MLLVVILSGYFISKMWTQWTEKTIVTVKPMRVPSSTLPFPAVTVCNTNLVRKSIIEQMHPESLEHKMAREHCNPNEYHMSSLNYSWISMYNVVDEVIFVCSIISNA